jgi:uncharacterized protein YecE (DUF72 family)
MKTSKPSSKSKTKNTDPPTKAERRAKQRAANVGRALKMHQARILDRNKIYSDKSILPTLNVGCSGWFYWDWRGIFYPNDLPTNKWFSHYAKKFKTVELNAPFYSWPTIGTVKTWLRQAGRRKFVYTIKVSELITHVKSFRGCKELIKDFGYIADMLGPAMGCFLFQLPRSFTYTPTRLKSILSQIDHKRRNVVEFRHESWWNEKVFSAFKEKGTIFCSCSGPKLPDELIKTADEVYIRFHGTQKWYRHNYSQDELKIWADRIVESNSKRVWVYFNNDYEGYAIKNAGELIALIKNKI